MVSRTSFTIFPDLPYELRCMIWQATCCPRVIEIEYHEAAGFTPKACDPIALTVCQESRNTIIQSYPLCFGSIFHPAKTRFNFSCDTLYIDAALEENVPHFFSTFGPLETSSLQFLALQDRYNELVSPFEATLTRQLQKLVPKFTALRELLIVYDVADMTDRTLVCSEGHTMELHAELPEELHHPTLEVDPLPKEGDEEPPRFELWKVKKCKPVYGYRRCPHGVEFSGPEQASEEDMYDEDIDIYSDEFLYGRPPPSMALSNMFGGALDSYYGDDDIYDYGGPEEEYYPDSDLGQGESEGNSDDAVSVASID